MVLFCRVLQFYFLSEEMKWHIFYAFCIVQPNENVTIVDNNLWKVYKRIGKIEPNIWNRITKQKGLGLQSVCKWRYHCGWMHTFISSNKRKSFCFSSSRGGTSSSLNLPKSAKNVCKRLKREKYKFRV